MSARFSLLDCTLRDGGYITDWRFGDDAISDLAATLAKAGLDYVEMGYLDTAGPGSGSTRFPSAEAVAAYLPQGRHGSRFLAMIDPAQFSVEHLAPRNGGVDGIRVVFYKHQVDEAWALSQAIKDKGYELFVQPMVTIDYTTDEYAALIERFAALEPDAISIVDSFGYMQKADFRHYFNIIDNLAPAGTTAGFHSHNNLNLAFVTAQDVFEYPTARRIVIDASLYGMGRGAGNLQTELIADYYNTALGHRYDTSALLGLISRHILPIQRRRGWGYSPYMFITGRYHVHPNFACFLLEEHDVTVADFERFVQAIPEDMRTKCRKPYVLALWERFEKSRQ